MPVKVVAERQHAFSPPMGQLAGGHGRGPPPVLEEALEDEEEEDDDDDDDAAELELARPELDVVELELPKPELDEDAVVDTIPLLVAPLLVALLLGAPLLATPVLATPVLDATEVSPLLVVADVPCPVATDVDVGAPPDPPKRSSPLTPQLEAVTRRTPTTLARCMLQA